VVSRAGIGTGTHACWGRAQRSRGQRDRRGDLADRKQMVVVTDHDSKVIARRTFRVKAWDLSAALDRAADVPPRPDSPG